MFGIFYHFPYSLLLQTVISRGGDSIVLEESVGERGWLEKCYWDTHAQEWQTRYRLDLYYFVLYAYASFLS